MGEDEEHQKIVDLVKELVTRLIISPKTVADHKTIPSSSTKNSDFQASLQYAFRILSSSLSPSVVPDAAGVAESIKRRLASQGKSSQALTFADLFNKLSTKSGLGSINNKWAVLYMLKIVSDDCKVSATLTNIHSLLPNLNISTPDESISKQEAVQNNGIIRIAKDSESFRDFAFKEYAGLVKEDIEIPEEVLVRDILYASQGIDGKFIKFDDMADGYVLIDSVKVNKSTKVAIRKLCELGWLFRKVRSYISSCLENFPSKEVGTVGQAFCAALQEELSEYYKLLAILEVQAMNPIPLLSETINSPTYVSLRRLGVWFAEPMAKMRLMAILVDKCKLLRGGAMVGEIHRHAQHGDLLVQNFMKRLMKRVCSPLFEMVRIWVLEGELQDIFSEFFIVSRLVKAESLWREGYQLQDGMLPSFISQSLAQRILRTGKSINFLRVCCNDNGWADAATEAAAATGTSTSRGSLGYGETDALENLVAEAARRIDKHLLNLMHSKYKFKKHCLAIKEYLLLGQGDFVQYLMDLIGPELSEPANSISTFKLNGLLETAIRASNAQYVDSEIRERLKVKIMPYKTGDRGWEVFSLDYDAPVPLDTILTESTMSEYLKIFNFLWKLRRVEHALISAWKAMKPNSHSFCKLHQSVKPQLLSALRRCQVLWDEMNHFINNLQYYIMFEVLEVSWAYFAREMEMGKDLDDLLSAHDKYLRSISEKSLLGASSKGLYDALLVLLDLILRFKSYADRLYEGIYELQTRSARDGTKAVTARAVEFLKMMEKDVSVIAKEYAVLLGEFLGHLPQQQHIDLKFLLFRLDFTEYYRNLSR